LFSLLPVCLIRLLLLPLLCVPRDRSTWPAAPDKRFIIPASLSLPLPLSVSLSLSLARPSHSSSSHNPPVVWCTHTHTHTYISCCLVARPIGTQSQVGASEVLDGPATWVSSLSSLPSLPAVPPWHKGRVGSLLPQTPCGLEPWHPDLLCRQWTKNALFFGRWNSTLQESDVSAVRCFSQ